MGLSKRREKTHLEILRSELSRLAMGSGLAPVQEVEPMKQAPMSNPILKEAKKKGRRKNAIIDGSKLLTC